MSDLSTVINWRRRDSLTTLSGQPTEAQFAQFKANGVTHVINLGPHTNKGALKDQTGCLADLGLKYTYIPVDFENPTQANFNAFCAALAQSENDIIHAHCIYNARVSAFYYRYALEGLGGEVQPAFELMDSIWRPGGVWAQFIGKPQDADLPIRYAGYDY